LEQRYWTAARERRADVDRAFPDAAGRDAPFFTQWCRNAFTVDDVPFLLRHHAERAQRWEAPTGATAPGVNLVGYLTRDFSLGDVARRLATALAEAEIPHASLPFERSASPVLEWPGASTHVRHATTIAVVTADQFPLLARDHPELFDVTERMIGYWFWELAQVPRGMRPSLDLVDEIWAPTAFVADAFSAEAKVPVHHVPLAIAQPRASPRTRTSFEALRDAADRIVFLVAFDHLSVTERKNPVAVIDAFTEAFEAGEGPLLLVKSTNGRLRWPQHQRVLAAARHRDDVRVWDAHLSREDQMALVAASDCFVSLHRSEGLGLHLAEAMWLGVPTIATRYSGNLDFMDDSCSMLVDATLVPVGSAGQGVYPPDATWADPDVAGAAGAMRTVAADAGMRARLAGAGRERMEQQRRVDTSPRLRELLGGAGADPMSRRAAGAAARMR
jgi:glycosyltransferase involved in cell wall biosynthesis